MNQPYYIAVCDDEENDRKQIREMAEEICGQERIEADFSSFSSAGALLEEIEKGGKYDLLLLDVMLPETDGIRLSEKIRESRMETEIVLISRNREMALRGYEVAAARYLAKPLDEAKLREAVLFCYQKKQSSKAVLLPSGGGIRSVFPKDIYDIEIVGRKSRVRLEREEWDTSLSISRLEEMLSGQGFIRCHQSFLVNCRYIRSFSASEIELIDGKRIPVSKHRVREARAAFFDYMKH